MKKLLLMLTIMLSTVIGAQVYAGEAVNVNTATVEQLQQVKGIGPKTAEAIVAYRTEHGAFASIEALTAVKGIGAKKLDKIKGAIAVTAVKVH